MNREESRKGATRKFDRYERMDKCFRRNKIQIQIQIKDIYREGTIPFQVSSFTVIVIVVSEWLFLTYAVVAKEINTTQPR